LGDFVINDSVKRLHWKNGKRITAHVRREQGYEGDQWMISIPHHVMSAIGFHHSANSKRGTSFRESDALAVSFIGGSGTVLTGSSYAILLGTYIK